MGEELIMEKTQWDALCSFFRSRTVNFKKYPLFYIYLAAVVVVMGGFSIWASIYLELKGEVINHRNIYLSLIGFSLPLIASFAIDLIKIETEPFIKNTLQIITIICPLVLVILFLVAFNSNWSYLWAIITVFLSLFLWWISNAKNPNLCDETYYKQNRSKEKKLEEYI